MKTFALALLISISTFSFAQKSAQIKFDTISHNFGKIKEGGGTVHFTYYFTNTGDDSLKLINVKPGCGCTTAEWTKTAIAPGQKGFIKAEYNPKGRPGAFNKAIMVTSNASNKVQETLIISGEVLPREKTALDYYPIAIGNLRFKTNHVTFLDTKSSEIKTDSLKVYNIWGKTMNLSFKSIPAYVKISPETMTLSPEKESYFLITYNAEKRNDIGMLFDYLKLSTNDSLDPEKQITLSANIMEDFSQLTPKQLKKAPKIMFDTTVIKFDTIVMGHKVKSVFTFKNAGKSDLIIRKVKASCGCTVPTPEKNVIKKGEKSKLDVEFNSTGKRGNQHITITITTNDPANSTIVLVMQGYVIEQKD